ncbi:dihydrolipoamide acetyltransferase family protein [Nocardia sp. NPDC088792]|uniref:dihydrolipoamide acetyltransferase family protein n=1 Tax=Nocardia sp. NPDC088792 TaxID=3364332 RepID=UPI00381EC10F
MEFRLPDLGEGLVDAELVSWAVKVGDTVTLNQTIAEVETAKAQVALPSPYAGTVLELLAQPGETVPVGAPLIRIGTDAGAGATPAQRQAVLVGYGPDNETVSRRARAAAAKNDAARAAADPAAAGRTGTEPDNSAAPGSAAAADESTAARLAGENTASGTAAGAAAAWGTNAPGGDTTGRGAAVVGTDLPVRGIAGAAGDLGRRLPAPAGRPAATPAARKLAREIGIDLAAVLGTGPDGAVTLEDLHGAQRGFSTPREPLAGSEHIPIHTVPPVTPVGTARRTPSERETRTPIAGIRKRTAAAMVASAQHIPQASTFVTTDFTGSMELLDHLRATSSFQGLSLTPLALVAKAALVALHEFPELNSYWDDENQQIVVKHYVNLGIAVASERGLLVPNLKEAQTMSLRDLCLEISRAAGTARSGTATPADLTGGTFTISNVGVFGVDAGVPMVNPGEAAILCLGSIRKRPWVHRDELAVRWVTMLGMSFDHRLIDGEQGSRFLASVAALLEDPMILLGKV